MQILNAILNLAFQEFKDFKRCGKQQAWLLVRQITFARL